MRTYYQITSELYQEHIIPVLNAKQYDSGRGVRITLTDCGAVVVPEATEQLRLYCKKEDGTVSYLPGTLSGSVIIVDFTNTVLAAAGMVECELQIGAGTDMVSTPVFRIRVLASNRDDSAVESTDEFTALETALATVQQYDTRIQTNADDIAALDTRLDTAENDIDALETVAAGLGTASTKGVANNLTTETAGTDVLDAAQGKALGDRLTTAESDITTLNDGYTNLHTRVSDYFRFVMASDFDAMFEQYPNQIVLFWCGGTNAPSSASVWIGLQWTNGDYKYGVQMAFTFGSHGIWMRRRNNSTTSGAWTQI